MIGGCVAGVYQRTRVWSVGLSSKSRTLIAWLLSVSLLQSYASTGALIDGAISHSCNNEAMYTATLENGSWSCIPCTFCPKGYRISQQCHYNRDTVCEECPRETYVIESGQECRPCTQCPPGYYVDAVCGESRDRKCKHCVDGYYSRHWNSLYCKRCRHCKRKETILELCNGRKNSVCGDCEKDHYRDPSSRECIPCSRCEGKHYIRVKECVRKLGHHSLYVCQPQNVFLSNNDYATINALPSDKTNDRAANIEALMISLPALMFVIVAVFLLSIMVIIMWYGCFKPSRNRPRLVKSNSSMRTTFYDCEAVPSKASDLIPKKDETIKAKIASKLNGIDNNHRLVIPTSVGNHLYTSQPQSVEECHNTDTDFLLQKQECRSPLDHRKKKKRKFRKGIGGSDFDILQSNRFAPLEFSIYTTV